MKKYKRLWKDKDIIILVSKRFNEQTFYSTMLYIGSVLFGLTDTEILSAWLDEVKEDGNKNSQN